MTGDDARRAHAERVLEGLAAGSFSGVVRVDGPGAPPLQQAFGLAERRWSVPMGVHTAIGIASGTKGFTAVAVMALVEAGVLSLQTLARALLGDDLPLVDDRVTVEHLLAHRSGIGDYLDESEDVAITEHPLTVPVHTLDGSEAFVPLLDGHPQVFEPGARFAYNNSGFVLLAVLAERAAERPFHQVVEERVCRPAGLQATAFHRLDRLPADVATGYLRDDPGDGWTNSLHLPVRGSGDGGLFTTAADVRRFWQALFGGQLLSDAGVASLVRRRSDTGAGGGGYGLGVWLANDDHTVRLEGYDAGASFVSWHDASRDTTISVLSNTSEGAWPVARALGDPST